MNFKKKHIVLAVILALVVGFIGAEIGAYYAKKPTTIEQPKDRPISKSEVSDDKLTKVMQAYDLIKTHYIEDVEDDVLFEGAIQGMLGSLEDPYSTYMDPEMVERFEEQIESSFQGIGAEVTMENGKVTIVSPIKDSPAESANLRAKDQILKIDNEEIDGLELDEAVELIRGERGTEVVLEVGRPGVTDPFEVTIVRDEIPLETVYAELKEVDGKKTGVIEITSFSETTAGDFTDELEKLEEEGIEGLVIDVRGNPGGLLDSVEAILKQFIPKDLPYIQIEDASGKKDPYYSTLEKEKEYPISVITDEGTASASEILAVALKEIGNDVVGTTSFGKGTVQNAVPLGDGSTIKLTFFKWLSPEGTWIHDEGVEPTVEVKQPDYFYTNPIQVEGVFELNQTGEKIENVQRMLDGIGYKVKDINGHFDKETEQAVKDFQKDHDLSVTGKIDEETAGSIEVELIDRIRSGEDDRQLEKALETLYE